MSATDTGPEFEVGGAVHTPYGAGEVVEIRDSEDQLVVKLTTGGTAYLQKNTCTRKKKLFEMTDAEKKASSKQHREEGNTFFKMEDFSLASQKYELAKVYLRQLDQPDHPEMLSLLNNIALTALKQSRYADSVAACDEAIANHFTSKDVIRSAAEVKCLYIRGQANRKRGDLESAVKDYLRGLKAAPTNKALRDEYESTVKDIKASKDKEAQMYKKVFEKEQVNRVEPRALGTTPATTTTQQKETVNIIDKARDEQRSTEPRDRGLWDEYGTTLAIAAATIGLALLVLSRR